MFKSCQQSYWGKENDAKTSSRAKSREPVAYHHRYIEIKVKNPAQVYPGRGGLGGDLSRADPRRLDNAESPIDIIHAHESVSRLKKSHAKLTPLSKTGLPEGTMRATSAVNRTTGAPDIFSISNNMPLVK